MNKVSTNCGQFQSTNSNNMSISYSNVSINTSHNWKTYKEAKEKTKLRIHHWVTVITSKTVKRNLANSVLTQVIVNTDLENIHEAIVGSSIITYLKELNKKGQYPTINRTMHNVFKDKMNDN